MARNEEANIAACLGSLDWCDAVLVADMGSTDGTAAIARRMGASVLAVPEYGFADPARNASYEAADGDWIFQIDADEMVGAPLARALRRIAESGSVDVVYVPRKNFILGQPVTGAGWWPDARPIFFRKGMVLYPPRVHQHMQVAPSARIFRMGPDPEVALAHFNYVTVEDYVARLNRYTSLEIEVLRDAGARYGAIAMAVAGIHEFFRRFIRQKGFRLGRLGLHLTLLQVFYRVVSFLKLEEAERGGRAAVKDEYDRIRAALLADRPPPGQFSAGR